MNPQPPIDWWQAFTWIAIACFLIALWGSIGYSLNRWAFHHDHRAKVHCTKPAVAHFHHAGISTLVCERKP